MPSLMRWSPVAWKHAYQQARQSPESSYVRDSVNIFERRGTDSQRRATEQFGVPLTCGNQKSYVRLNARVQAPPAGKYGRPGDDTQVGNSPIAPVSCYAVFNAIVRLFF